MGPNGLNRRRFYLLDPYLLQQAPHILFAAELQRRATASGSTLTSTAAHPGISGTNLIASSDGMGATPVIGTLTQWVVRAIFPDPAHGAEAVLYAATEAAPGS